MHIREQIIEYLGQKGFSMEELPNEDMVFVGYWVFPELAGQLSNGRRRIEIRMCPIGRWLEKLDGWGKPEKCIELRSFWESGAEAAIKELLKGK